MLDPLVLDNLRPGAEVISTDGEEVGKLHAVVVDPRDDAVTHIVVNAGPFFPQPGFGAPRLVSVPIDEMADAREKKVILKCTRKKFSEMPDYARWSYTPPTPAWRTPEGLPRENVLWSAGAALVASLGRFSGIAVPWETIRKGRFEREILHDAPVWRTEPHTHIGDVERVLVDEVTDEVAALVIRRGVLFHHDVILPIEHLTEVLDGVIHVRISDEELERLEEFRAPPEP
ncbi:MAG TPA: PRC-barrel domain-containing protein [Dehalococcoidia bacterium]|nr:PRC-barrel domain-containing protein [Dehalococcoidia bacterium]